MNSQRIERFVESKSGILSIFQIMVDLIGDTALSIVCYWVKATLHNADLHFQLCFNVEGKVKLGESIN